MINWPPEVIKDIARRRSVIFLGSGISRNSQNDQGERPKTWEEFLKGAASYLTPNQHIKCLINKEDYLTSCEILKKLLGKSSFNQYLRDSFLTPQFRFAPIHEAIFKLDSRIVATPNFDKIYETYANNEARSSIIIKHHYDSDVAEVVRNDERVILKIHGTIDRPDKMVFTRKEYAEARSKYTNFYMLLEALALTHTFLFLGCGISDPDMKLLLEDIFFSHPGQRPHFFVLPKSRKRSHHRDITEIIEQTMNLKILQYSGKNNHQELLQSVNALVKDVEDQREELRKNGNW